jgi:cobalamin biosynthesis protein CobT
MKLTKQHGKLLSHYEKMARALSSNYGVKVVASNKCSTNGDTIYYPSNADHFDKATKKVLDGWLDHEIGHIVEEKVHQAIGRPGAIELMNSCFVTKTESLLLNVFEDIRMERVRSEEFIGVAENLKAAQLHGVDVLRKNYKDTGMDAANFWHVIGCYIICVAHNVSTDWAPTAYGPLVAVLDDEIEDSHHTKCAEDCLELGRMVIAKLADRFQELKDEQESREENAENDDDGSDGAGGDGDDHDGGDDSGDSGDGDDSGGGDDNSDGQDNSDGDDGSELTDEALKQTLELADHGEADVADLIDVIGDELGDATEQIDDEVDYRVDRNTEDKWVKVFGGSFAQQDYKAAHDAGRKEVAPQIKGMKGKLTKLLMSRAVNSVVYGKCEGEIDDDELWSVETGNDRIYCQEVDGESIDTAISLLVDMSGSMGGGRDSGAWYAMCALIGLGETLSQLRIPFEIIGFHSHQYPPQIENYDAKNIRCVECEYVVFKSFKEKFRQTRANLGAVHGYGLNIDHEAVISAAKRLAQRPERRKIMFVLSDGKPNCLEISRNVLGNLLRKTVRQVTQTGIEIIGVGMKCEVGEFYNKATGSSSVRVDNMDKFAITIYKVMKECLMKNRKSKRGGR